MIKNSFLAAGVAALFAVLLLTPSTPVQVKKQLPADSAVAAKQVPPPPEIEAQSALAYDFASDKILFEKNKTDSRALASLTKIISSLVILNKLDPEEEVEITKNAVMTEGLSSLLVGEHFRVRDLLAYTMVESSNDAVEALVLHLAKKNNIAPKSADDWFLNLMRDEAASYGANTMMFYNPTGLDATKEQAGAYGSAEDLINIVKVTLNSELWQFGGVTEVTSEEGRIHKLKPTDTLAADLSLLVGGKTGFTDIAGGNLLIIVQYPLSNPIAIVVLGSSEEGRFADIKAIFDWIRASK